MERPMAEKAAAAPQAGTQPGTNKAGKGAFYAVGVGPGDPELLTLKAVRLLEACPVVAAPRTAGGRMVALDIARQAVDLRGKEILPLDFSMSPDPVKRAAAQQAAAGLVRRKLEAGLDVAMVNIGDVSLYATCSYLMEQLEAEGFATARAAGVPSFCAAAARLNISLTGIDTPLHIYPAAEEEDLAAALRQPGTKILMKSARRLPAVLAVLKEQGLAGRSALVANCGLPGELALPRLDGPEGDAALDAGYFVTVIVKEG